MDTTMPVTALKRIAGSLAFVAILPVTGLMASGTPPAASARAGRPLGPAQPAREKPEPVRTATLEVVTEVDRSPLPGATLFIRGSGGRIWTWEGTTDDRGRYTIVPPSEATRWFDVVVASAGYERGYVSTVGHPAPVVVSLRRAEVNRRDRPGRAGAADRGGSGLPAGVCLRAGLAGDRGEPEQRVRHRDDRRPGPLAVRCPAGRVPPDAEIRLRVTHPDHIGRRVRHDSPRRPARPRACR